MRRGAVHAVPVIPFRRLLTFLRHRGARKAVGEKGKSLLPPGVAPCEGDFAAGDVVRICDANGTEFARGIAKFDSAAVRVGTLPKEELIHRDDLVLL